MISNASCNNSPSWPLGQPFLANHSRYSSGSSMRKRPWYLPKGITMVASVFRSSSRTSAVSSTKHTKIVTVSVSSQAVYAGLHPGRLTQPAYFRLLHQNNSYAPSYYILRHCSCSALCASAFSALISPLNQDADRSHAVQVAFSPGQLFRYWR